MSSHKSSSGFGRDEMNLLLGVSGGDESKAGIGTAGTALLQSRGYSAASSAGGRKRDGEVDIASLSTAETAALLQQQQANKGKNQSGSRHRAHRTQKRMQHHELLEQELRAKQQLEQQQQQQQQEFQSKLTEPENDRARSEESDEGERDEFAAAGRQTKKSATNRRIQLEPQIVAQKDGEQRRRQRRRRRTSSSESSSSDESEPPARRRGRQRRDSSSSSDGSSRKNESKRRKRSPSESESSSSEDEARQRLLKKRQQLEAQTSKEPPLRSTLELKEKHSDETEGKPLKEEPISKEKVQEPERKPSVEPGKELKRSLARKRKESSSSESSSSSGSDDDSNTSDSSSSDDDEPAPAIAKPLFVPKHKRQQLAQEKLELERAQKEQEELAKKQEEQRKMESRSLVAQVVAATNAPGVDEVTSEDEDAQAERILNDKDDLNPEEERDLWEVRELERLLTEIDRLKKIEQEQAEYRRRQKLTDEEARAEDMASGRYQKPGSNRMATKDKDGPQYLQKYFHRGAYYMDEDEFEEGDVRRRAKEYEQGVTESAKNMGDIRKLPKVMQVKQFGRANQSQYQGLSKEDTSKKESSTLLPLVHHKNPHQRKTTDIPTSKHKKNDG